MLELIKRSEFDRLRQTGDMTAFKLQLFADMCRLNTLTAVKKAGSGHLGSSFSAMDIVTYLYLNELNVIDVGITSPNRDIYFSSKGHDVPGLYALFFALGILEEKDLLMLRRFGGLDGHPDVGIPGIESNTGSLGMGISKGKGMAWAKHYLHQGGRVFVLTGDGEFQEGQIYESLQTTAHQHIVDVTVIVDHNKFQTDKEVNDIVSLGRLQEKLEAFGWHTERLNGHDFSALSKTFDRLKMVTDKPKIIIADTIKGKGISFMEPGIGEGKGHSVYRWHSGAPDDEHFLRGLQELKQRIQAMSRQLLDDEIVFTPLPTETKARSGVSPEYVAEAYGKTLCEIAKERTDIVVLDGDLSADCRIRGFEQQFPDRFIENGIAEQDMVSMAGGLARLGLLPVVNTFASFLTARANEQIYNNACEKSKIIYACHFSGMIPAGPGKSHQSVRDISLLGAIPNMTIIQPANAEETAMALRYCVYESKENCALRLAIGPSPRRIELPGGYTLSHGIGSRLTEGEEALLFSYGPVMLHEALSAANMLLSQGFGLSVVNMPWLNRVNMKWLQQIVEPYQRLFVLEDHSSTGGLGQYLLTRLAGNGLLHGKQWTVFGLEDYPVCGTPLEVLAEHRLDAKSLVEKILGTKTFSHAMETSYSDEAPQ